MGQHDTIFMIILAVPIARTSTPSCPPLGTRWVYVLKVRLQIRLDYPA